jgi:hypothetical protein
MAWVDWCSQVWLELLRDLDEHLRDPLPPMASRFFRPEVVVRLLSGFKQLLGSLDDHELLKGLHLDLQGIRNAVMVSLLMLESEMNP